MSDKKLLYLKTMIIFFKTINKNIASCLFIQQVTSKATPDELKQAFARMNQA